MHTRNVVVRTTAPEELVREVVQDWSHDRYHSVPLPYGLSTPGRDYSDSVEDVLGRRPSGKTVLDIGSYYGLYPIEAHLRGARSVAGIEMDGERLAVAREINELWGSPVTYHHTSLEAYDGPGAQVVTCMNVLHHFPDPLGAVAKLASLASETLIIEFPAADEPRMIQYVYTGSPRASPWARVRATVRSWALRLSAGRLPILTYSGKGWFFSETAFRTLFSHHFRSIRFRPSRRGRRIVAFCER